jgi:hypothetical protein
MTERNLIRHLDSTRWAITIIITIQSDVSTGSLDDTMRSANKFNIAIFLISISSTPHQTTNKQIKGFCRIQKEKN